MTFKNYDWNLVTRIALLFVTLSASAFLLAQGIYLAMGVVLVVVIVQVSDLYRFTNKSKEELEQFVESVHYRDFSRHFDEKNAPVAVQPMRKGFNEINSTFKIITKERETQYQYLQKILELVDTGIISYDSKDGDVMWMNESFKKLLSIPYLKTIHSLEKRDPALYEEINTVKPGETKVSSFTTDKNTFKVLLSATAFQTEGKVYKLVAFQNINEALDETESKAWQKLLSVMTHEIMNSIAPISSLAETLKNRLQASIKDLNNNSGSLDDLELGIDTIKRRSEGLLRFAETYRNLNKITNPNLKKIYVRDMFENLHRLMEPTFKQKRIELEIILKDPELMLEADTGLIEQVLINLVLNAAEAVKEAASPRIQLSAYITPQNKVVIKVADNGIGIPPDILDKIFIPFFSTRKTGSGIGLSLCKQIMMLHKGTIKVQSVPGEGTAFSLFF
ncbi:MAG TPA: HAMP domain-containing sensor histidine kinase [Ferruginibacter sp.]|jgi:nitrogen fixation/metabolism regulation signal transduction histidine kinase|nr:HAMP domain-containing histidine kinase [Chitinophagales bacterium]HMX35948.1 HAMP domain-containing sensor histidine kinase [Ferruginibacter sp.]HMX78717.1 HAMP domain-containing sensor histidine kinase [Ferruginibacter sp.]HNA15022.1 HAMP domain-containing sensor histidine kinase [Ferruginibacter sp.]HNH21154.1 HAMP domain-containing sensor histidine kinase [Ferruginibacter sp.]